MNEELAQERIRATLLRRAEYEMLVAERWEVQNDVGRVAWLITGQTTHAEVGEFTNQLLAEYIVETHNELLKFGMVGGP